MTRQTCSLFYGTILGPIHPKNNNSNCLIGSQILKDKKLE